MMMMNMEIMEEFAGSSDQIVVKGKQTKRPRPSTSTTSSGGDVGGGEIWSTVTSPTTSSGISTSTEEDEDMANCLILLARGGFPPGEMAAPEKFISRKFTEMAATANGSKVGIFVYECKTCSRTFPSFQALGGHRASHKKPKSAAENDKKKPLPADDDQEEEEGKFAGLNHIIAPPTSSELMNHKTLQLGNKPKIHECSLCGSEFASGQALGGHMRRHRSAANKASGAANKAPPDVSEKPRKNVLALDLNLPAPPEDDHQETNLNQFPVNQQRRLVLSAATLVDCHY